MNEKLRDSMLAEAEIVNTVRLAHGEAAADGVAVIARQARLMMLMVGAHISLLGRDIPESIRQMLISTTRESIADVLTSTMSLVLRDVDDPGVRSAICQFSSKLIARATADSANLLLDGGDA